MRKPIDPVKRFWRFVQKSDDPEACWLWTGTCYSNGYAAFWDGRKKTSAFRFAYIMVHGPIPSDHEVHHKCGIRKCVNISHLEAVTHRTNMIYHIQDGRTMKSQPMVEKRSSDPRIRFFSFVDKNESDGCWEWTGSTRNGYGRFAVNGRLISSHRYSYELVYGPIPHSLQVDHLCKNTKCQNPEHMELVTQYENNMRSSSPAALHARKMHCLRGHAYSEHGFVNSKGSRECTVCRRDYAREYARERRKLRPKLNRGKNSPVCKNGHALEGENLKLSGNRRLCRICLRAAKHTRYWRGKYPNADFFHEYKPYGLLV